MGVCINEYLQYKLYYSSQGHRFYAEEDGVEVESAYSEQELRDKLKAREKRDFKRVAIAHIGLHGEIIEGEVTSLVDGGREAWISMKYDDRYHRQKLWLSSGRDPYFEITEANRPKIEQIRLIGIMIEEQVDQIKAIKDTLEKPINRDYFGVEKGL